MKGRRLTRTALRRELRQLSRQFAEQLFETLERYGVWEDLARRERATSRTKAGGDQPRARRSEAALLAAQDEVLGVLRTATEPLAISAIARRLGVTTGQIAHPIAMLVARGTLIKTGERRGARYAVAPTLARRAKKRPRLKSTTRRTVRRKRHS